MSKRPSLRLIDVAVFAMGAIVGLILTAMWSVSKEHPTAVVEVTSEGGKDGK